MIKNHLLDAIQDVLPVSSSDVDSAHNYTGSIELAAAALNVHLVTGMTLERACSIVKCMEGPKR